nr:hypothetical protein [Deltaproteobacteria bacterium]
YWYVRLAPQHLCALHLDLLLRHLLDDFQRSGHHFVAHRLPPRGLLALFTSPSILDASRALLIKKQVEVVSTIVMND